jgi:hypothetical protein
MRYSRTAVMPIQPKHIFTLADISGSGAIRICG